MKKEKKICIPITGEIIVPFVPIGYPSTYHLLPIIAENSVTVFDRKGHFIRHMGKSALKVYLRNKTYYEIGG